MIPSVRSPVGQLARTRATDGIELEGFWTPAGTPAKERVAVIHVHGMFENFHLPIFVDPLLAELSRAGFDAIAVNTRAQDYYYYHRKWDGDGFEWQQNGGSYEIFSQCIADLDGWVSFCRDEIGIRGFYLSGHSHGALKAAYYAAKSSNADLLRGIILLSPSDDIGIQYQALGDRYEEAIELAESWEEKGDGDRLVPEWLYSSPMSAKMYLDMFKNGSDLAIFPFARKVSANDASASITAPSLVVFGEDDVATAGVDSRRAAEFCKSLLVRSPAVSTVVVPGANHQYKEREEQLVDTVVRWLNTTG